MVYPGVQKLIDLLKTVDDSPTSKMGFDMARWYAGRKGSHHPCGSACCIEGWAASTFVGQTAEPCNYNGIGHAIVQYCGLPDDISIHVMDELTTLGQIYGSQLTGGGFRYRDRTGRLLQVGLPAIKLPLAIRVLEIFRDTGEVKWTAAFHELNPDTRPYDSLPCQ